MLICPLTSSRTCMLSLACASTRVIDDTDYWVPDIGLGPGVTTVRRIKNVVSASAVPDLVGERPDHWWESSQGRSPCSWSRDHGGVRMWEEARVSGTQTCCLAGPSSGKPLNGFKQKGNAITSVFWESLHYFKRYFLIVLKITKFTTVAIFKCMTQ